ncbi:ROK family transcriptional regulator [Herbidospora mongoliensis]|uniref:ROK family transcriptional regulator n=1 Tax=Herbidospora mongoliensis TaxID=688067 RepID=UPI00082AAC92|nr:ROK family transcriptional regulator [Herbidospora mongoliensis]
MSQRSANRTRVIRALRERGPLSRRELADLGLSRSTVTVVVDELIGAGVVIEVEGPVRGAGRPAQLLSLNPRLGVAVGVEIANGVVRAAVCDVSRRLLSQGEIAVDERTDPKKTLVVVGELIERLLDGRPRESVLGVGVAIPGPIQRGTGRSGRATTLKPWVDVNPYAAAEALRLPLAVDNDANLAAVAEATWGVARGLRDVAYVYSAAGIGVGFILNGSLYAGANGTAGELGHTTIDENGEICECGGRGCLNTLANAFSITQNLRRSHGRELSIAEVITLAHDGDLGCRRVIADAGRHIGLAAANLYNLLDPELIVLGGNLAPAGEILLGPLRESMARRAIHAGEVLPPFIVGELDQDVVVVLGAAAVVLRDDERFPLPVRK